MELEIRRLRADWMNWQCRCLFSEESLPSYEMFILPTNFKKCEYFQAEMNRTQLEELEDAVGLGGDGEVA